MVEWSSKGWLWGLPVGCVDDDRREVTQDEVTYRVYAYFRSRHIRISVRRMDTGPQNQAFEGPVLEGKLPYPKRRRTYHTIEAWVEARLPSLRPELEQLARLLAHS